MLALISKKLLPCCLSTLPPYVPQASEQTDVPRIEVLGIRELARPEEAAWLRAHLGSRVLGDGRWE